MTSYREEPGSQSGGLFVCQSAAAAVPLWLLLTRMVAAVAAVAAVVVVCLQARPQDLRRNIRAARQLLALLRHLDGHCAALL